MKIAILGWGSLVWDPQGLPIRGGWQKGGPKLRIEFSRVSKNCRLTLVIDPNDGAEVPTQFAVSKRTEIEDAICDLRCREGTIHKWIGFVAVNTEESNCETWAEAEGRIRDWARENEFDAVVWTDLSANFEEQTGNKFTVDAALEYLTKLPKSAKKEARKYIRNAPKEVKTPLRMKLDETRWVNEPA